jgi:hypothetical protein
MEIDFVASLIENGADRITKAWQTIFKRDIKVCVAGVFCHQSPMVRITDPQPYPVPTTRCELADLLILHSHINADGKEYWRAVLMQTKVVAGAAATTPDEPQFWLYDRWPRFAIMSPGFDPRVRDFYVDTRSGRYGLLSNSGWLVSRPANPLRASSPDVLSLANFLVEMLYDMDPAQSGRISESGRQVYRSSKYDWSPTIWDLLRLTAVRALRHKGKKRGLYAGDMSRMGGQVLQLFMGLAGFVSPPDLPTIDKPDDDDGGINVLVIQTSQSEYPAAD